MGKEHSYEGLGRSQPFNIFSFPYCFPKMENSWLAHVATPYSSEGHPGSVCFLDLCDEEVNERGKKES